MNQFNLYLILIISFFIQSSHASANNLTFEPLYGIETSLVRFPEPARYVTRATYGARVLYGTIPLSGELEYTEAHSRNDYPGSDQKVEDKSQRLGLGIRSTLPLSSYLSFYARGGGRASQGVSRVTTAGITETHKNPLQLDPYAGAGLQFVIASNLSLNAGATLIRNDKGHYDSQYTLGINARFGSPSY